MFQPLPLAALVACAPTMVQAAVISGPFMARFEGPIDPIIDSVVGFFSASKDPLIDAVQATASDATAYLRIASLSIALYE
jgi:hypothetical protein